ncbi:MAG: carboxypeptidase regulatory-like domain-containing protein [Cytophagales bacterium]|nr:carboxypeptidase regulatory-like domain-containing protein [Cytophagales bacterium]MDW8384273.1 carboxypeptidase regulatory-like domain-containing protein [Flammeovirgaceae bacterium]
MKVTFLFLTCLLTTTPFTLCQFLKGDRYISWGINQGFTTYQGDLSPKNQYFHRSTAGMNLGMEISKKIGDLSHIRGNLNWCRIRGSHEAKKLTFRNDIFEFSTIFQLDFFHLGGHYSLRPFVNPYFFGGIGLIYHNPKGFLPQEFGNVWIPLQPLGTEGQGILSPKYSLFQPVIPFGAGINFKLHSKIEIGIEVGLRPTFTDYLDDVGGKYVDNQLFGNNQLAQKMANPTQAPAGTNRYTNDVKDSYLISQFFLRYILSKNLNPYQLPRIYAINQPIESIVISERFTHRENRYKVTPMRSINSEYDEMCPTFHRNGILFISDRPVHNGRSLRGNGRLYNLFYSPSTYYKREEITKPVYLDDLQHKNKHFFSPNSSVQAPNVIFTMYHDRNNTNRIPTQKIYFAEPSGEYLWSKVVSFPYNSECYSITHPSLSEDGTILYFVSDMSGGLGGTDIYISRFIDGQWTLPQNIGQPVNTPGNELFPFIHQDGTLYFASDGHAGMGGLDIFEAIPDKEIGRFVRVENVGSPINSPYDDFGLVLDEVKRLGYFTSDRPDFSSDNHLHGKNDIYELKVEKLSPSRLLTDNSDSLLSIQQLHLIGKVINKSSGNPVPRAVVKIRNLINDEIQSLRSNEEGIFSANLFSDGLYEIGCSAIGFEFFTPITLNTLGKTDSIINLHLYIEPAKYKFTIRGQIKDEIQDTPLPDVLITVLDLEKEKQYQLRSNAKGEYTIELENEKNYTIHISEKGYAEKFFHISTYNKKSSQTIILNMTLKPLQ